MHDHDTRCFAKAAAAVVDFISHERNRNMHNCEPISSLAHMWTNDVR